MTGLLSIVGTPIGNLGDLSPRAADCLRSVDAVVCEDSRRAGKLLSHIGPAPGRDRPDLIVANDHTEVPRLGQVLDRLGQGQHLALISDAGMPTVSDPGTMIVRAVADAGHRIEVIPGPSAVSAALALSGLDTGRYVFEGFLPRKGADRRRRLAEVADERRAVVIFESPHRVAATVADLARVCGPERRVGVCRELTKLHEEVVRGTLSDVADHLARSDPRGEFVLVLEPDRGPRVEPTDDDLRAALGRRLDAGSSRRDAVAEVVAATGLPKRRIYDLATSIRTDDGSGRDR